MAIRYVRALPPNESCNNRVNLESRNGIWASLPTDFAARELMQRPNGCSERQIGVVGSVCCSVEGGLKGQVAWIVWVALQAVVWVVF